jgi:uncharacterized protein YdiU (UPF0061 family)
MKTWLCVAREEQIANPGDYLTGEVMAEPYVITRDKDGKVNAFLNMGRHRGVPVAEGAGDARGFSCPYHAWYYNLEGKLMAAPHMDQSEVDLADCSLRPIKAALWSINQGASRLLRSDARGVSRCCRSCRSQTPRAGISEAMAALRIPTTRALAAVTTGEQVWRETSLPGAVLTRVASSHIRVGTFQFFAARGDLDAIRRLADHVIARNYPQAVDAANRYRTLLDLVISRQAALIANWQLVGFIHGVMNTDNMSIAGETIDYGPCAFMDVYHPETLYSSIDSMGRYAYGNQPRIAQWNLARLAETLLPLLAEDKNAALKEAPEAIDAFATGFETAYAASIRRKLGLFQPQPDDLSLARDLLERMARNGVDFTLIFRRLCDAAASRDGDAGVRSLFTDPSSFDDWAARWRHRLAEEGREANERRAAMRAANPAFIPRNHLVEEAISAAVNDGNFRPFEGLLTVLAMPYEDQPALGRYIDPPRPDQVVHQTFCGT